MSTWILILTLYSGGAPSYTGAAINNIPGFRDENSCMIAAAAWLKISESSNMRKTAICVEQKR